MLFVSQCVSTILDRNRVILDKNGVILFFLQIPIATSTICTVSNMEEGEKRRKKRRIEKERERRRKTGKKVVEWHDKYLSMRFKSATKCRRGGRKPEEKYTTVYRIIRDRIGEEGGEARVYRFSSSNARRVLHKSRPRHLEQPFEII